MNFSALLKKALHALRTVVHDPNVDREGKALVAIVAVRALLALGASASTVTLVEGALKAFGI